VRLYRFQSLDDFFLLPNEKVFHQFVKALFKPGKAGDLIFPNFIAPPPVMEGRSFGTNMLEAALIAVSGQRRVLTQPELEAMINQLGFEPSLQTLNPRA